MFRFIGVFSTQVDIHKLKNFIGNVREHLDSLWFLHACEITALNQLLYRLHGPFYKIREALANLTEDIFELSHKIKLLCNRLEALSWPWTAILFFFPFGRRILISLLAGALFRGSHGRLEFLFFVVILF